MPITVPPLKTALQADKKGNVFFSRDWIAWLNKLISGLIITSDISDQAITAEKIKAGTITATEISAGSITADKIAAGAVTTAKLYAGAITAEKIAAGAIETDKLAAGAVTANKIGASAIETDKLAAGAVTAAKVTAGTITATELAANAVTATKIAAGAIDGKTITGSLIRSAESGGRTEMDVNGFRGYSPTMQTVSLGTDGVFYATTAFVVTLGVTGTLQVALDATFYQNIDVGGVIKVLATQVVGARGAAVADAAGGANIDAEARTALNALLARLRAHGLIAT